MAILRKYLRSIQLLAVVFGVIYGQGFLVGRQLRAEPPDSARIDFARDVIPVLTKAGCNSGACHGAAAGRGYLTLSLFGSRPASDYQALVHAPGNRFIDHQQPMLSLFLQKPSGYLDHEGGIRLDEDSPEFDVLRRWVEQGSGRGSLADLELLEIAPSTSFNLPVGQSVRASFSGHWSDGSQADVASRMIVDGADREPATSSTSGISYRQDPNGLVFTAHKPGYWPVNIRMGKIARTIQIWSREPSSNLPSQPDSSMQKIDQLIAAAGTQVGIPATDAESPRIIARRLWIDLCGVHPTVDQWTSAAQQIQTGQTSELVDHLLHRPEFTEHAGRMLAGWLPAGPANSGTKRPLALAIQDYLHEGDNLQQLARKMLTVPESDADPASVFHRYASDPRSRVELIGQTFMGVRLGCAQCHDHPLDKWTQDDYFAFAACWSEIESEGRLRRIPGRTTTDLRKSLAAVAALPGDRRLLDSVPPDIQFIDWLCADDNPFFARNAANRLWFWMMGVGLVEDIDDQRATNPPINPQLLVHLTQQLRQNEFSLRSTLRSIALSDAYARQATQEPESKLAIRLGLARMAKPIDVPLHQLAADTLGLTTASDQVSGDQTDEMMMMVQSEPGCSRGSICNDPTSQNLDLVAGPQLNNVIRMAVVKSLGDHPEGERPNTLPAEVCVSALDRSHVRLFGRPLNSEQRNTWITQASETMPGDRAAWMEDVLWSWVISPEFIQLH